MNKFIYHNYHKEKILLRPNILKKLIKKSIILTGSMILQKSFSNYYDQAFSEAAKYCITSDSYYTKNYGVLPLTFVNLAAKIPISIVYNTKEILNYPYELYNYFSDNQNPTNILQYKHKEENIDQKVYKICTDTINLMQSTPQNIVKIVELLLIDTPKYIGNTLGITLDDIMLFGIAQVTTSLPFVAYSGFTGHEPSISTSTFLLTELCITAFAKITSTIWPDSAKKISEFLSIDTPKYTGDTLGITPNDIMLFGIGQAVALFSLATYCEFRGHETPSLTTTLLIELGTATLVGLYNKIDYAQNLFNILIFNPVNSLLEKRVSQSADLEDYHITNGITMSVDILLKDHLDNVSQLYELYNH